MLNDTELAADGWQNPQGILRAASANSDDKIVYYRSSKPESCKISEKEGGTTVVVPSFILTHVPSVVQLTLIARSNSP